MSITATVSVIFKRGTNRGYFLTLVDGQWGFPSIALTGKMLPTEQLREMVEREFGTTFGSGEIIPHVLTIYRVVEEGIAVDFFFRCIVWTGEFEESDTQKWIPDISFWNGPEFNPIHQKVLGFMSRMVPSPFSEEYG